MAPARVLIAFALLGPWALPSVAVAANPAVQACEDKSEGDPCGLMKMEKPADGGELQRKTVPGACQPDECCDLDYSKGSPPETVCHPCLACKEGPAGPGVTPGDERVAPGDGEPPRSEGGPPAPSPTEQRGCTLGGRPGPQSSWLLGLLAVAAVGRRRRSDHRRRV